MRSASPAAFGNDAHASRTAASGISSSAPKTLASRTKSLQLDPQREVVNVVEPRPNPETVAALLDITWRVAAGEAKRTEALDRKATAVATFAAVLATLSATLGVAFVDGLATWWAFLLFVGGIVALVAAVALAVAALEPEEYLSLGARQLERYSSWSVIREPPEKARGDTMKTIILSVSRERRANARKAEMTRHALRLVVAALVLVCTEAVILAREHVGR